MTPIEESAKEALTKGYDSSLHAEADIREDSADMVGVDDDAEFVDDVFPDPGALEGRARDRPDSRPMINSQIGTYEGFLETDPKPQCGLGHSPRDQGGRLPGSQARRLRRLR